MKLTILLALAAISLAAGSTCADNTAKQTTSLDGALAGGSVADDRAHVNHGADVRAVDIDGHPVWFRALGRKDMMDFLVSRSIDIDQRTADGQTALDIAVATMTPAVVADLLHRNADPNLTNRRGQTPYEIVSERRDDQRGPIIKLLVKAGERDAKLPHGTPDLVTAIDSDEAQIANAVLTYWVRRPRVFCLDPSPWDDQSKKEIADLIAKEPDVPQDIVSAIKAEDPWRPTLFPKLPDDLPITCLRLEQCISSQNGNATMKIADGFFEMTMPVFDLSKKFAVAYLTDVGFQGVVFICKKSGSIWIVDKVVPTWIS